MEPVFMPLWTIDWAWGLPLIVFTVILHAYSLGILNREVTARLRRKEPLRLPLFVSIYHRDNRAFANRPSRGGGFYLGGRLPLSWRILGQ